MGITIDDRVPGYQSSGVGGAAVTPHDSNNLGQIARALWIGTGGDVTIDVINPNTLIKSKNLTFKNVPSGYMLDLFVSRVYSTNTTASDIVAVH